eukprot:12977966-Alexandrium_andersonii.AAC.1
MLRHVDESTDSKLHVCTCALALDMSKHFSPHRGGATPPHERSHTRSHRTAHRFKPFRGDSIPAASRAMP